MGFLFYFSIVFLTNRNASPMKAGLVHSCGLPTALTPGPWTCVVHSRHSINTNQMNEWWIEISVHPRRVTERGKEIRRSKEEHLEPIARVPTATTSGPWDLLFAFFHVFSSTDASRLHCSGNSPHGLKARIALTAPCAQIAHSASFAVSKMKPLCSSPHVSHCLRRWRPSRMNSLSFPDLASVFSPLWPTLHSSFSALGRCAPLPFKDFLLHCHPNPFPTDLSPASLHLAHRCPRILIKPHLCMLLSRSSTFTGSSSLTSWVWHSKPSPWARPAHVFNFISYAS